MKPGYIFYGIHNDFSFVGGGLRKGCHMLDARQWMGWGAKFLHIERKKQASFIPTCPPTTYANMRLVDKWRCSQPAVRKTKLKAFSFMLPHCTAHMLKTISLRGSRVKLKRLLFSGWPYRLSSFGGPSTSPPPSLQQAFCGMPPLTSQPFGAEVTCVLKNWNHIT